MEYQKSGEFKKVPYRYICHPDRTWSIERDGEIILNLSSAYQLVKPIYCGICTTDLTRQKMRFGLPLITGHEVVGYAEMDGRNVPVAVEINTSCKSKAIPLEEYCRYCKSDEPGLDRQCTDRLTLGIDTLPGGFGYFLLAPSHSLVKIDPKLPLRQALLWEPFAAALQAVQNTPFERGFMNVAVLGPRKLGQMIISALVGLRNIKSEELSEMKITAIGRHQKVLALAKELGADETIDNTHLSKEQLPKFHIVYDCTGTMEGLETALQIATKIVHLKSTSGAVGLGMANLTPMVIDEISILPCIEKNLSFRWPSELKERKNNFIYLSPLIHISNLFKFFPKVIETCKVFQLSVPLAFEKVKSNELLKMGSTYPHFDLAIVSTLEEADQLIRPTNENTSIVRPRGAILIFPLFKKKEDSILYEAIISNSLEIRTSRCGDAQFALQVLSNNLDLASKMEQLIITHQYDLQQINEAFQIAKSDHCIKAIISIHTNNLNNLS
eukprot:TRINITY_DN7642_c0_g1_i1.p1 TRINITY_DN7642_c0_g1~~TRINITY_DN7642_c0_g1_i1.p1  ORF type:complete len:514 (+),score=117.29 TRINITY_DN7642_c0_g1_i1:52-1542(+)